jgi:Holliday junction resolvase
MSKSQRDKGSRVEREIVDRHEAIGIHAERYPQSGGTKFRNSGHDIDIYANGRENAPLVAECKARKHGGGFTQLEKWLSDFDVLFLRRDRADPLVLLPWRTWVALLEKTRR